MKKALILLAGLMLLFTSCQKEDIPNNNNNGGNNKPVPVVQEWQDEKPEALLPQVDDRIVLAYCTYYGTRIPDCSHLTHINYAFAELYVKDGEYRGFGLQGNLSRWKDVVGIKEEHPEIKILLSFANTTTQNENYFSVMAGAEGSRIKFAQDCLEFVEEWGIDGIDLDWEFPGLAWSGDPGDTVNDVANYNLLMKQLRETLGDDYLLTYAGYVMDKKTDASGNSKYIDIAAVDPYVNYVNLMTYDISDGTQHQSAWDCPSYYWDCKRTIKTYMDAGISPTKLVLGIPFYARHAWSNSDGYSAAVSYKNFKTTYPAKQGFKIDNWDAQGEVPYISKNGVRWAGYDNPRSIKLKGQKILEVGMKGMMYWDYDQDNDDGTLRAAVWNAVMQDKK